MAGTFQEGVSKVLSGVYSLIKAAVSRVTIGTRGVVSYPFTSNWGPTNTIIESSYAGDFDNTFNASKTALTAKKVYDLAFKGKPSKVLSYRMATAAAEKGTVSLQDSAAGVALVLETLYPTDRAFTATVKDGVNVGDTVVEITEGGVLLVSVTGTTAQELADGINASNYVRTTTIGANVPVNVNGVAFTGGNNGSTVTVTEYSNYLTALEAEGGVNAFSLDGVTDDAIIAVATDWTKRVRDEGVYVTFVNGGPAAWDSNPDQANAKSKSLNSRGIVNVGNGVDGYTAADMAIFGAARVAAVALNSSVTDEATDFGAVNVKLTRSQRITAKQSGTLVFVQEGAQVVIDEGVNTLTVPGANESIQMGKIRVSNALDQVTTDLEVFGNEYKKGRSNTQEARQTFAATVETDYLAPLQTLEVIQGGYFYEPDPEYHGKNAIFKPALDEAYFYSSITPVDSMEKLYQKLNVNF